MKRHKVNSPGGKGKKKLNAPTGKKGKGKYHSG